MGTQQYNLATGGCWSGRTSYTFRVDDKLYFPYTEFHSEAHAKREAVEHLAAEGIHVDVEDIGVEWNGCL